MMKILVTGGSGFIGTNLVEYYLKKHVTVMNIDISAPRNTKHIAHWKKVDILDYQHLKEEVLKFKPEFIIHMAARTDLDSNSISDYTVNTLGVSNIIEIANLCSSIKRIIFTSSMLVCDVGYIPQNELDYCPKNAYGKSKVMSEKIVHKLKSKFDWVIIRPTSIWGPWFNIPYRTFFEMIINKRYFHFGHNKCIKTYGYVENLVYQVNKILHADAKIVHGNIYYLGDYTPYMIEEWADEIAHELGSKILRLPIIIAKILATLGDLFGLLGIPFLMTSFRLKNMTTDNIINMNNTSEIVSTLPYSRLEGIRKTLKWLKNNVDK